MIDYPILSKELAVSTYVGNCLELIRERRNYELFPHIPAEKIIVIEYSSPLVKKLHHRFPKVQIIEGNAANLISLLGDEKRRVKNIVSSIPLRSLPKSITQTILNQVKDILPTGGRYIQFTYSFQQEQVYSLRNSKRIISKRVWMNLPPARVDVWVKM